MQKRALVLKAKRNIVWLKRDLRLNDHLAFYHAEKVNHEYIPKLIFEPSAMAYQTTICEVKKNKKIINEKE
jgi:deoxyribodipyrimidine photolyase